MKLDEYINLEEKQEYFEGKVGYVTQDINYLFGKFEELSSSDKYIFRGSVTKHH